MDSGDREAVKALGPGILPPLAALYSTSEVERRTEIAHLFYWLGWKSEDARRAMWEDLHTEHSRLRLAVQWALGRVSNDDAVVEGLIENMIQDPNALFRDKAACGLAHDQIHLSDGQQRRLYERLIGLAGLRLGRDPPPDGPDPLGSDRAVERVPARRSRGAARRSRRSLAPLAAALGDRPRRV